MLESIRNLRFILPDWDDIVDPGFDFLNERFSDDYKRDKYAHGARVWTIFKEPPLDGVLVSRSILEVSRSKMLRIRRMGIKDFLKIPQRLRDPKRFQVIGDCGAWQYRYEKVPPYDAVETLDFYQRIGVDYGVSVVHIAFFGNPQERIELTYNNAKRSYGVWKKRFEKGDYTFILLAAVQGIEMDDYIKMFERLYRLGYRHFAIGGLAKRSTDFIERLVDELAKVAKHYGDVEKVHFLGIARPSLIKFFARLEGIVSEVSFDNATYLRMAWTRSHENYITIDGKAYTAIRVRPGSKGEDKVLEVLRRYDEGSIELERVIEVLREYARLNGDLSYLPYYVKTLEDRPWKSCDCVVCKGIGIDVVIFRGNDRNRRRGFHNLYVFYKLLKSGAYLEKSRFSVVRDYRVAVARSYSASEDLVDFRSARRILVIANCSDTKTIDRDKVLQVLSSKGLSMPSFDIDKEDVYREVLKQFIKPAEEMYSGLFNYVRKLVNTLRAAGKEVDLYILSARYGLIPGDRPIVPYDAPLKALSKEELYLSLIHI
mgnify:CR=1 FL=1